MDAWGALPCMAGAAWRRSGGLAAGRAVRCPATCGRGARMSHPAIGMLHSNNNAFRGCTPHPRKEVPEGGAENSSPPWGTQRRHRVPEGWAQTPFFMLSALRAAPNGPKWAAGPALGQSATSPSVRRRGGKFQPSLGHLRSPGQANLQKKRAYLRNIQDFCAPMRAGGNRSGEQGSASARGRSARVARRRGGGA